MGSKVSSVVMLRFWILCCD